MGISSNLKFEYTGELAGSTGTGITQTVGHAVVSAFTYSGADVSTNIADCTTTSGTITAPGAWTDIVDFDIGAPIKVFLRGHYGADYQVFGAAIRVASGEDADDAIRMQILVDGVAVWDSTVTKDSADVMAGVYGEEYSYVVNTNVATYLSFNCQQSFQIRATRNGTFAEANTDVYVGQCHYVKLK